LTLSGSVNPVGVTVIDPVVIGYIVLALSRSTAYGPATSNSRSWAVGVCGSEYELSASGAVCSCATGYDIRPCIENSNWGRINGATCGGVTQIIIVVFSH
jgi:hypothetical protein